MIKAKTSIGMSILLLGWMRTRPRSSGYARPRLSIEKFKADLLAAHQVLASNPTSSDYLYKHASFAKLRRRSGSGNRSPLSMEDLALTYSILLRIYIITAACGNREPPELTTTFLDSPSGRQDRLEDVPHLVRLVC